MRTLTTILTLVLCCSAGAATASWNGLRLYRGWTEGDAVVHGLSADIHGVNGEYAWIHSSIYGHVENGGLYLKHFDFSGESMEPTFNWWALALYGDIVGEATFASHQPIELFSHNDSPDKGGTLIETPDDFYMVFKVSEVLSDSTGYVEGMSWYGWAHVSVDANLDMTLLGADINLQGGAITVGAGIPEPSGGVLFLLGAVALALRRRRMRP